MSGPERTHQVRGEILALTGVRGYLAWWVVLFHFGREVAELLPRGEVWVPLWKAGDVAVDVFFMLSGFVIYFAYRDRLQAERRSYGRFLWARLARLYPVHLAQQAAWYAVVGLAIYLGKPGFGGQDFDPVDLARCLLLVQSWSVPLEMPWNYPAWSISLEWLAYLLAPGVFAFVKWSGLLPKRPALRTVLTCTALWALVVASRSTDHQHLVRILCEFSIGAQLSSLYIQRGVPATRWPVATLLAVLFVATCTALWALDVTNNAWALPLAAAFIFFAPSATSAWLTSRFALYQGRVSYSLYMTHALSITVVHRWMRPEDVPREDFGLRFAVLLTYVAVAMVHGIASYHIVERPAERYMRALLPKATSVGQSPGVSLSTEAGRTGG